jgi:glutamyl-tRNA synthetase/nondiscriminating glutamyl-tRNA synthetase
LFARQKSGIFILRIEDTDLDRSEARFEDLIYSDLRWLGLDWDEGPDTGGPHAPYRQSERLDVYRQHAERLLAERKAYLCFCTAEQLEAQRQKAMAEGGQPIYPGTCRALDPAEATRRRTAGEPAAIRLQIPERPIRFHDLVRGDVEFASEVVSDPIILRSNGMPVYNYTVVIDDAAMEITHVIRGDDHLSNTPKQVALYEALGWPVPEFAHLSTILGGDRERLSKRHGATSLANFRDMGVLPEALMNYLALLGWAPSGGDREIFSKDELVKEFALERVTPSPAVFDIEKLYWLNRHYIKQLAPDDLLSKSLQHLVEAGLLVSTRPLDEEAKAEGFLVPMSVGVGEWFTRVVALFAPAVDRLDQIPERVAFLFHYDAHAAATAADNAEVLALAKTPAVLDAFARRIAVAGELTVDRFNQIVNEVKEETGAKGKELYHPIRITITGSHSGPAFDKVIPLIEQGSRLELPQSVPSVAARVAAFMAARVNMA